MPNQVTQSIIVNRETPEIYRPWTNEELKTLLDTKNGPFLSIFMPTHRMGSETQQDPIRFKNLVVEAEERLIAAGLRSPVARDLLEPAQALIDNDVFWQHQQEGLAVFLAPDLFRTYRLPLEFEELLFKGDRFYLKPLLPLLSVEGRFYLLALSQNEVRLFQGSREGLEKVELEDVPASLAEALRYDNPEKQQQFHTATASSGGSGQRPAMFHGHGGGTDEAKTNLLRYFQQLDRGLSEYLTNSHLPLMLAGVEYLFPIYREANTYPHLLDQGIAGNPEAMSAAELHQRAWPLVQAIFEQERDEAMARYEQFAGTGQASADLTQIVPAAHYGRVDTLFVAKGQQQWGAFDPETNTLHLHPEATATSEDLLDLAAVQTFLRGGTIYVIAPDELPSDSSLAAIFRYQV